MLRITWIHVIGKYTVEAEDVKIDCPEKLAIYLIGTSIGVKKDRNSRNFEVAK